MTKRLERMKAKGHEFRQSGKLWRPGEFELRFKDGLIEARDWLHSPDTREELEPHLPEGEKSKVQSSGLPDLGPPHHPNFLMPYMQLASFCNPYNWKVVNLVRPPF